MNMGIVCFIYLAAFVCTIASAIGKCPLWIPVLLITVGGLVACFPR